MSDPIVIIGSGFAAYQLVKAIRRQDANAHLCVITADDGHDYNKPDLSHVFSKAQNKDDLVLATGEEFAQQHQLTLLSGSKVDSIDAQSHCVRVNGERIHYSKLVLATGASPYIPLIEGNGVERVRTLNSLDEFAEHHDALNDAQSVMVLGGGLIGVEIALDLANAGKNVVLVEPAPTLMVNQLPELVGLKLQQHLRSQGIDIHTNAKVEQLNQLGNKQSARLNNDLVLEVDEVVVCAGLRANTELALSTGALVNKGIVVDQTMQTTLVDIYALGDCAEFMGEVRAYLQPILLSANALAKTLLGTPTEVVLPTMMVKVKTPSYPIQLAGVTSGSEIERWQIDAQSHGMVAKAYNSDNQPIGFIATDQMASQAFALLRELATKY